MFNSLDSMREALIAIEAGTGYSAKEKGISHTYACSESHTYLELLHNTQCQATIEAPNKRVGHCTLVDISRAA